MDIIKNNFNDNEENNICTGEKMQDDIDISLFSFKGRAGRMEFIKVYSLITLLGLINGFFILPTATDHYAIAFFITYCLISAAFWPMTVRRLHDSNLNGRYYLINLMPPLLNYIGVFATSEVFFFLAVVSAVLGVLFLYLILRSGDSFRNNYGDPNPSKKYSNKSINIICAFLFLLILISVILANF
nr:DUF805 domain-containing protein [uncultured Aminipila sp.]